MCEAEFRCRHGERKGQWYVIRRWVCWINSRCTRYPRQRRRVAALAPISQIRPCRLMMVSSTGGLAGGQRHSPRFDLDPSRHRAARFKPWQSQPDHSSDWLVCHVPPMDPSSVFRDRPLPTSAGLFFLLDFAWNLPSDTDRCLEILMSLAGSKGVSDRVADCAAPRAR